MSDQRPGAWLENPSPQQLQMLQDALNQHAGNVQRQPARNGNPSLENQDELSHTDDRVFPDLGMVSGLIRSVASDHPLSHNDGEAGTEVARVSGGLVASGRSTLYNDDEVSNEVMGHSGSGSRWVGPRIPGPSNMVVFNFNNQQQTDARTTTINDNSVSVANHTVTDNSNETNVTENTTSTTTDNHVATSNTSNSAVENISTTDDHRMSTTTTSSTTTNSSTTSTGASALAGAAWQWRVIRVPMSLLGWLFTPWSGLLVFFVLGVLLVFRLSAVLLVPRAWLNATSLSLESLSWGVMAAFKFAFGAPTRADTPVPLTAALASFDLSQETPKIMMIARSVALGIDNIVAFYPSAARLAKPPESHLAGPLQELELVLQESLLEALAEDLLTLEALLYEQRSMPASAPVSWAMRLLGRTHYTAVVARLKRLADEFKTMQRKRENLMNHLFADGQVVDGVFAPLSMAVCTWSDELSRARRRVSVRLGVALFS